MCNSVGWTRHKRGRTVDAHTWRAFARCRSSGSNMAGPLSGDLITADRLTEPSLSDSESRSPAFPSSPRDSPREATGAALSAADSQNNGYSSTDSNRGDSSRRIKYEVSGKCYCSQCPFVQVSICIPKPLRVALSA